MITLSLTIPFFDFYMAASKKDPLTNANVWGHYSEYIDHMFKTTHKVTVVDHSKIKRFPRYDSSKNEYYWYIEGEIGLSLSRV